ncbi:MAG: sensor histidine kinase [Bacteriovoracaceae bacterium]
MHTREERIQGLMLNEIAHKSVPAAIAFAVFAIVIFFFPFGVHELLPLMRFACVGVVVSSLYRIAISKVMKTTESADAGFTKVRFSVWLNTFSWTVIIGCVSWELHGNGPYFLTAMMLITGFCAASLVTLAYDKWSFFPFNTLLLGVPAAISIYYGVMTGDATHFFLSFIVGVFLLYQLRQYFDYRKLLSHRFKTQVELEDTNKTLVDQSVKLAQASKASALVEMAGGLSHEVNNSLMVILGNVQQLARKLNAEESLDLAKRQKIERTVMAIQKIRSVVDGLKSFSNEGEAAAFEEVPLSDVMERTLNYCKEMVTAHGVAFTMDDPPDVKVKCHPMELTQAMFSIIKNADEAVMKSDPKDRWIRIRFGMTGEKIVIKIINGGHIIDPNVRQKIFQPFFTTKEVGEGTGLSLSIAKGIFREHGGDITLQESNEYTCFLLELPCTKL